MHGTPTHRRLEVLPEPVDLAVTIPLALALVTAALSFAGMRRVVP